MLARYPVAQAPAETKIVLVECSDCHGTGAAPLGYRCCGGQGCEVCSQGAPSYAPWPCDWCDGTGETEGMEE